MSELLSESKPRARKDYNCQASEWLINVGLGYHDFTKDELALIDKAEQKHWQIKKGHIYLKQTLKHFDEIVTFRAIPSIHKICIKYGLYYE